MIKWFTHIVGLIFVCLIGVFVLGEGTSNYFSVQHNISEYVVAAGFLMAVIGQIVAWWHSYFGGWLILAGFVFACPGLSVYTPIYFLWFLSGVLNIAISRNRKIEK